MDRENYEQQRVFAGEKKPSMKRRLVGHDYNGRQMYMVTMVVEGRRPLFGCVVGRCDAPRGSADAPRMELTELGRRVSGEMMAAPLHHPEMEIVALQMMPDHLHAIIFVKERMAVSLGMALRGFKQKCNQHYRELVLGGQSVALPTQQTGQAGGPQQTEQAGGPQQTGNASHKKDRRGEDRSHGLLFEPSYNDQLLLHQGQLEHWKAYLHDNPRRLLLKRERPHLLRPFFNLPLGSHVYNGIGNRDLLSAQQRMAVRVSRRLTGQQLEAEVERYLEAARGGAVLVSPAISPGEKMVMRRAFDLGLPTIVVLRNGFTPLSKPKGEQFDACSAGRLLMLSAWEHQNERIHLTAYDCQQLNLMALELSGR